MNGVAENAIKHIMSRASVMMSAVGIPLGFWPEAIRCATYLKNRSPHQALDKLTPYEAYYGAKPDLSHVRVFGCRCYAHVEKENRQKLDSHSVKCVFMGYYSTQRLFAVFDVTKRVMLKKRDIVFVEHVLAHPTMQQYGLAPGFDNVGLPLPVQPMDNMDNSQPPPAIPQLPSVSQHSPPLSPPVPDVLDENALLATVISTPPNGLATAVVDNSPEVNIRDMVRGHWSGSTFWQPKSLVTEFDPSPLLQHFDAVYTMWKDRLLITDTEFDDVSLADMSLAVSNEPDPLTLANAMASPNNRWWLQAAYQEMCQLARMGTFDFIDTPPPQRKALATKWVWKTKRLPDGKIERFKARWVARGDLQKKGTDYVETFAPVAMLVSIRVLLTLVALLDLELDQLDVVGAFLHGGLDSEVYLRQPVGFALVGDTRVCALCKSLYGLCQVARAWYNVLHNTLQELGFQRLITDTAVWKMLSASLQFVAAHVDDMLCGGSRDSVDHTKSFLSSKFEVRDMGPASVFIGLRIVRDRERRLMYIDQSHYGRDILDLYNMADCNPCLVPMNPADQHLSKALPSECLDDTQKRHYQSILGSLGFLMNCSRPDLAFAVNKLSQFASAPAERHLIALKRVLRYLRGTTDSRLLIADESGTDFITAPDSPSLPLVELRGWFDASWADNPDDSRSTFGYTRLYGHTALIWKSKKHKGVTLSTTDAEYLAATEITREICFLQNLFGDLQVPFKTYCFMPISFYSLPTSFYILGNSTTMHFVVILGHRSHYHSLRCYTGLSFPLLLLSFFRLPFILGTSHYQFFVC